MGLTLRARMIVRLALVLTLVPLLSPAADAATVVAPPYSSRVDGTVIFSAGQYTYNFQVFNTTATPATGPLIVDWELPFFSLNDLQLASIQSPTGWTYDILNSWSYDTGNDPVLAGNPGIYGPDPEKFETAPYILHWYTSNLANGIAPGNSLAGFSFLSTYNSLDAPYLSSWDGFPPITGDPPSPETAFATPDSPARQNWRGPAVPEPSTMAMFAGLGLSLAGRALRRRRA